ncbi:MAG TPA: phospholipid scramblase-related protein [Kofleriaceae bacterium]
MDTSLVQATSNAVAPFVNSQRLSVRQKKRWLEILFAWESKNQYLVFDQNEQPVFEVQEQGKGFGNLMKRLFMGPMRWFTADVESLAQQRSLLSLKKPFRFIFHRLEVRTPDGTSLGAIQKRWTWFRRKYTVEDAGGQEVATLFGPFFRPWTFKIRMAGSEEEVGLLQKKWSGLGKELFSDADNFWIQMENIQNPQLRALLFSATVLIDVVHFERSK